MITGKVEVALLEAEPEVLEFCLNVQKYMYGNMPCVVLMYSLTTLQAAIVS